MEFSEIYYKQNNLSFKALLVLDNAHGYPTGLNGLGEHVNLVFIPLSTQESLDQLYFHYFGYFTVQPALSFMIIFSH
jgi:hypothetical protein